MIRVHQKPALPQLIADKEVLRGYIKGVITDGHAIFVREHSKQGRGRLYSRNGIFHRASKAGDFPAKDTGTLLTGTKKQHGAKDGVIGTDIHYAIYLTNGTARMAARKMFKEALDMSLSQDIHSLDGFIRYK